MPDTVINATPERLANLRKWNLSLTVLHLAQAVGIFILTGPFAILVTSTFPEGPPGFRTESTKELFSLRIGPVVGVFLLLAALDHFLTATVARSTYEQDLSRGINRFRWTEYSVSATLMVVLIAMYSGITDYTSLVAIIGANVAMILFGWLQESSNPPGRTTTTMKPFWFGTIAGLAPWIGVVGNLIGADTVPTFVMVLVVLELLFFFSFALNQWLQYRGIGRWNDYLYGEKVYLVLSLVAKSYLAWQIYGGSLAE